MSLLEIRQLSKTYRQPGSGMPVRALKEVSFGVEPGETLAVVGGSGCGKSTLARILVGLLTPDSGDVFWEGQSLLAQPRRERAHRVQMVFQDPYASLNPKLTVGTQLEEVRGLSPVLSGTVPSLLESVGLPADAASHYPFQFSGGQRQRIAIARALALNPRLLIADEPLSALDVGTQAQILELFRELRTRLGLTILFITHDLALAASFADRVVVLREGRLVEEGPARQTLENPTHVYTRALVEAVPRMNEL